MVSDVEGSAASHLATICRSTSASAQTVNLLPSSSMIQPQAGRSAATKIRCSISSERYCLSTPVPQEHLSARKTEDHCLASQPVTRGGACLTAPVTAL